MYNKEVFADILIKLREESGLTQEQLADELKITRQSLSLYEKSKRTINIELFADIANYFNVSADYLLGRTETKSLNEDIQQTCKVTGLSEIAAKNLQEWKRPLEIEESETNRILEKQKRYSEAICLHPQDYLSAIMLEEVNEMPCPLSRDEVKAFNVIMQHITNTQVLEMINDILSIETEKQGETYGTVLFKQIYNYCKKEFTPINYKQQDEGGVYTKEISVDTQKNAILLEISKIIQELSDKIKEREKHG